MKKFVTVIYIFFLSCAISAQNKKTVEAVYLNEPLKIDAILDEQVYKIATPASDFVQLQPYNGKPSFQPTEAYYFYDQSAIYVGAMLYDKPDSIFNYLTERDNIGTSDYFGVYIDPYNQGQLAYGFFITPAGVQVDIKATKSNGDNEDGNWNAVWESKTRITDKGWIVEMRIPYSALRFSEKSSSIWGLNMFRNLRRYNSNNSWNFVDRKISGFIHQEGQLTGIRNIKPPVRLSFSPYIATYYEPKSANADKFLYKGGLDLKYGINDAFTLDMMLIPDFGQIQSDDQKLNLSPYELYYDEKRQFFTEGTELFQRGDIFYSRRIGASPKFPAKNSLNENEVIDYSPNETQLVNATKISGRTDKGWGIGFLNAMSLPSYAVIKNEITDETRDVVVQPFTNYNVMVVDKSLKNNSYMSIINTNISMINNPFHANVTATEFEIRNKTKTYALKGKGGLSTRGDDATETGYFGSLGLEKNQGKFHWGLAERFYSDKYNPNDLGYLQRNNQVTTEAWMYYQIIEPFWIFRECNGDVWWNYNRMYNPNTLYDNEFGYDLSTRFTNNFYFSSNGIFSTNKYDYFEPRVAGRFYYSPYSFEFDFDLSTDFRKPLSADIGYEYSVQPTTEQASHDFGTEINWRIGQRFSLDYGVNYITSKNEYGFADYNESANSITFAKRVVSTFVNSFQSTYVINNKSGIKMRIRHYWSGVENSDFFLLQNDGSLTDHTSFTGNVNQNYNAFTIDMIFRWIFAPGSELSLAWKTLSYSNENTVDHNYWNNLQKSWLNQSNSISLKVLYYIDYNNIFKKNKNS
ncbi:MAG: carbohydrate binding family 9 domain-containing protein [Bacteroidales bacterium]|nr:carbohydrate binding family 9 domain-containing protein [Bacteroidales bacterium]